MTVSCSIAILERSQSRTIARDLAYMRFTQIRIKDAWVDGELMFSIRHSKLVIYSACFDNGRGSVQCIFCAAFFAVVDGLNRWF